MRLITPAPAPPLLRLLSKLNQAWLRHSGASSVLAKLEKSTGWTGAPYVEGPPGASSTLVHLGVAALAHLHGVKVLLAGVHVAELLAHAIGEGPLLLSAGAVGGGSGRHGGLGGRGRGGLGGAAGAQTWSPQPVDAQREQQQQQHQKQH